MHTDSPSRPDLAIFNAPSAFVDGGPPFGSVVLVEFKRPTRNDYDGEENPIIQLYDYVREIKAGSKKDHHGRPINVAQHTPFYGYIVCDITSKLRMQAENAQLTETPDSNGYFGYNSNVGIYIEVISFDKLVFSRITRVLPCFGISRFGNLAHTAGGPSSPVCKRGAFRSFCLFPGRSATHSIHGL